MADGLGDKPMEADNGTNTLKPPQMGLKLVHLDLKGAPPKVSYLVEIFPLLSHLGADGILLEYEDMFPYEGKLQVLRSPHAYSPSEIREIMNLARVLHFEVIPLVQTIGHMEEESMELVKSMIDQIMAVHKDLKWLHVGSDEVYHLGESEESQKLLAQTQNTVDSLFLSHVRAVANYIVTSYPNVKPIVWDDMLRNISEEKLKESMLSQFVELMIWEYNANFKVDGMMLQIQKYQRSGFSHMWFASAFKGSTGAAQSLTPISYHLANHLQWLKVAEALSRDFIQLHGIALTGWQRYDHFSVLCELLPVGLPSLAVCLQTLKNGVFSEKEEDFVKKCLGFKTLRVNFISTEDAGSFPGSDIFNRVTQIITYLQESVDKLLEENIYIKGWFSNYHRKRKFVHPSIIQHFEGEVRRVHAHWKAGVGELSAALEKIYYPDTVEEWLEEHVHPTLTKLQLFVKDMDETLASEHLK
ncbi:hexosaminidase D-like isoform X2 [Stegostoma tigrinum]|uniref:hexosaminidase D-like isoform X2 n=1 Tax=Stegostoma tigrinum TaxID=3053191 RepID=UPI00202AF626|nr:hexosaminidase D-like isoform X2 [Stegostoma tigrinum]